ncbi:hypothetical protein [Oceanicola sp. 22II-s10i]|uniref:hypothetical protein n=1 Tax=Oceanicola sp. 22II-s10i TaxID=1317116 RepID=UPI000B522BBA|nr:hypothetical protein [Oceanicola sp. 22II-s10i]
MFALVFVVRTLFFVVYWSDPAHRNQAPEVWMTPRYIAHSWQIPPEALAEALQIPDPPPRHATLAEIARLRGMTTEALIAELTVFLARHRQATHE